MVEGEGDVICAIITNSRQDCRCAFWFKCISLFGPLHVLSLLSFFAIIIINLFGDEGQKINYTYIILYKKYFNPKTFSVVAHA